MKPLVMTLGLILGSFVLGVAPSAQADSAKDHSRLEELFIWKTSEELKLPASDEQAFTDILHKLADRKRKANEHMDQIMKSLAQAKTPTETNKALTQYHAGLKEYHDIQFAEIDQLKKLLGAERLAKYLVVKSELNDRIKTMLSQPTPASAAAASAPPAPLGTPKIIEEK